MLDLLWFGLLLIVTGVAAGIINTLAGGGANLTLPALMVMDMPPDVANATNRVAVFLQSLTALLGFRRHGRLPTHDLRWILLPTLVSGLLGALVAAYLPPSYLKPLLLGSMLAMTLVMLLKPSLVVPAAGTSPRRVCTAPSSLAWLCFAGFYGGFVQAGVGFVLIAALAGSLRYDLVAANALKVTCILAFTAVALVVFIAHGLIRWGPGLTLAVGSMLGAHIAVRFAISAEPATLRWLLFLMTLGGTAAVYLR